MIYVFMYLLAIVLANLSVYYFGITFVFINAFLFIGLDLTARDKLHDKWDNNGLFWKMSLLILSGSLLSCVFAFGAWQIALASFLAFLCAGIVDTVIYKLLKNKKQMIRINGSNIPSAITDSIIFPTVAFGQFLPLVILGQALAKICGGFFWSLIITKKWKKTEGELK